MAVVAAAAIDRTGVFFVPAANGQIAGRVVLELLRAGCKVTAGVPDQAHASVVAELACALRLLPSTSLKGLRLVQLDVRDPEAVLAVMPKNGEARVVVVDGDAPVPLPGAAPRVQYGVGRVTAEQLLGTVLGRGAPRVQQLLLVSAQPQRGSAVASVLSALSGRRAAAAPRPSDAERAATGGNADSFVLLRCVADDGVEGAVDPGCLVLDPMEGNGAAPEGRVSRGQVASVAAQLLLQSGPASCAVRAGSEQGVPQLSAVELVSDVVAYAEVDDNCWQLWAKGLSAVPEVPTRRRRQASRESGAGALWGAAQGAGQHVQRAALKFAISQVEALGSLPAVTRPYSEATSDRQHREQQQQQHEELVAEVVQGILEEVKEGEALEYAVAAGMAANGTALNGTALGTGVHAWEQQAEGQQPHHTAANGTALNGTALNGTALNGTALGAGMHGWEQHAEGQQPHHTLEPHVQPHEILEEGVEPLYQYSQEQQQAGEWQDDEWDPQAAAEEQAEREAEYERLYGHRERQARDLQGGGSLVHALHEIQEELQVVRGMEGQLRLALDAVSTLGQPLEPSVHLVAQQASEWEATTVRTALTGASATAVAVAAAAPAAIAPPSYAGSSAPSSGHGSSGYEGNGYNGVCSSQPAVAYVNGSLRGYGAYNGDIAHGFAGDGNSNGFNGDSTTNNNGHSGSNGYDGNSSNGYNGSSSNGYGANGSAPHNGMGPDASDAYDQLAEPAIASWSASQLAPPRSWSPDTALPPRQQHHHQQQQAASSPAALWPEEGEKQQQPQQAEGSSSAFWPSSVSEPLPGSRPDGYRRGSAPRSATPSAAHRAPNGHAHQQPPHSAGPEPLAAPASDHQQQRRAAASQATAPFTANRDGRGAKPADYRRSRSPARATAFPKPVFPRAAASIAGTDAAAAGAPAAPQEPWYASAAAALLGAASFAAPSSKAAKPAGYRRVSGGGVSRKNSLPWQKQQQPTAAAAAANHQPAINGQHAAANDSGGAGAWSLAVTAALLGPAAAATSANGSGNGAGSSANGRWRSGGGRQVATASSSSRQSTPPLKCALGYVAALVCTAMLLRETPEGNLEERLMCEGGKEELLK